MSVQLTVADQLRGDTWKGRRIQYQINGTPRNLTNVTIRIEFRKKKKTGELLKAVTQGAGITIEDQTTNPGWFSIDKFIVDFPVGVVYFDIQFTENGDVDTPIWAEWNITQDITQPPVA
jgi:hypothetical protein